MSAAATVVLLVAAGCVLRLWLGARNAAHVRAHAARVPPAFAAVVTPEAHARAAAHTVARERLGAAAALLDAALVLAWTLGGGLAAVDGAWRAFALAPLWQGVGVIICVAALTAAARLPLALWRVFVIGRRFGLDRTTPRLFAADLARRALVAIAVLVPASIAALWLMMRAGPYWWLSVWALWAALEIARSWAYPSLVAPLFDRFAPLAEGALKARLEALAARARVALARILVADASRRTAHANASVTGLGASKRVVLHDTLLTALADDEVEAVLAHELGHLRGRHVETWLAAVALARLATLAAFAWAIAQPGFFAALGLAPSTQAALVLFAILLAVLRPFVLPAKALLLRRFETEADAFAARHAAPQALARALEKLTRTNAATLTPDPLAAALQQSHPPLAARVAWLDAAARR